MRGKRKQQQPDLVLLARQAGGQEPGADVAARAVMETRAKLVAQEYAEEVLLGHAALGFLPAQAELDQQWQQHPARGDLVRIQRQQLVVHVLQPVLVELRDGCDHAFAVARPGSIGVGVTATDSRYDERLAHLADRHALVEQCQHLVDRVDVGLGVEAMAAVGAHRSYQTVATFPGAQGDGIDASQGRDGADREQPGFTVPAGGDGRIAHHTPTAARKIRGRTAADTGHPSINLYNTYTEFIRAPSSRQVKLI